MISSVTEIIAEAKNGRMVILVDDENRENEGDLFIPADCVTPEIVNFMITHARGLVCLPLEPELCEKLSLPPMVSENTARNRTAFTISIEAKEGITTGISAFDRCQTIRVALDPKTRPDDLARPGHVFPIRAAAGGLSERAGHTEAAVTLARLAGYTGAGVICEILNADGTMARLPALTAFAASHGLKIGTIADLAKYVSQLKAA